MSAEPPKPKMTPNVWSGRIRLKVSQGVSKFNTGQAS